MRRASALVAIAFMTACSGTARRALDGTGGATDGSARGGGDGSMDAPASGEGGGLGGAPGDAGGTGGAADGGGVPAIDGGRFDADGAAGGGVGGAPAIDGGRFDADGAVDASSDTGPCMPRRCGIEIACGVAADGCGDSVTCDPCPDIVRPLRLAGARHLVVDHVRGVAYVTVDSTNTTYPNSLLTVTSTQTNPKVTSMVAIGNKPNLLVMSDDASTLWVALDGDNAIRKVDLTSGSPVPGASSKLPMTMFYPYPMTVGGITLLRGSNTSVAVSLLDSTGAPQGAAIIDDGVPRGTATYLFSATAMAAGRTGVVFAVNGYSTGFDLYPLQITSTGFTSTDFASTFTDFVSAVAFADDRLYASSGDIIDVTTPAAPMRVGKLPTWGSVLPLSGDPRALLLSAGSINGGATLRSINKATLAVAGTAAIQGVTEYFLWDMDLIAPDNIVFLGTDVTRMGPARLMVARSSLLP
jgi:hypothetical protein